MSERTKWLLKLVEDELDVACASWHSFASPHEGWAVIREEVDELWEHVKANTGRGDRAQDEAIQIAAMALRYVQDLAPWGPPS